MPTIGFDDRSFQIDGRRIWMVSGSIHYSRVPRELWLDRIRAAKTAGLNCIQTPVFWNLHESQPGLFDFSGQQNLKAFVTLVGQEGLHCVLQAGPYVDRHWTGGGIPPWVSRVESIRLREAQTNWMELTSRFFSAVLDEVRDLQVTATKPPFPRGGPVFLFQVEHQWFCHHPQQAESYLQELARFLREAGCTVPIVETSNLWQQVDGVIATWNASTHLARDLRQLRVVQPRAPRLVNELGTGPARCWDQPAGRGDDAATLEHRLGQILASGGQYNIHPFHGGTHFGFSAGRLPGAHSFVTTSYDCDAPLTEAGMPTDKFLAVKRISTFASQFAFVLAHLDNREPHAAVNPEGSETALSVFHQTGAQGQVVFILRGVKDHNRELPLLLPSGQEVTVPLGEERVVWMAAGVNLAGVAELTYTNLRPWAFIDRRLLVLFGPAGAEGVVCINDAALHLKVPTGRDPAIESHEGLTLVILSTSQVDAAIATHDGLLLGASLLTATDKPAPLSGWPMMKIDVAGQLTRLAGAPRSSGNTRAPRLSGWQQHVPTELLNGDSEAYQPLDGPTDLAAADPEHPLVGYGFYRLTTRGGKTANLLPMASGDRLHVFQKGKSKGVLGIGPGAKDLPCSLSLAGTTVVMAEQSGRFAEGLALGEAKGLAGPWLAVKPASLGKATISDGSAPDPFQLRAFIPGLRHGETLPARIASWSVKPVGRKALVLDLAAVPGPCIVTLSDKPLALHWPGQTGSMGRYLITADHGLTAGSNRLAVALLLPLVADPKSVDLTRQVKLLQVCDDVTAHAQWAFARWTPPADDGYRPATRTPPGVPCWYRTRFNVSDTETPLWLEPIGLTKGQILLNGHNVGRYFVATATGKAVHPQHRYLLPSPWLKSDHPNELVLFDEHGRSPAKVRLVYGSGSAFDTPRR